ncbi:hypothetical protein TNCV_4782171 [Trichonephila clavipes]|nr:hypothetical protein TNCV_4782171 [Trichonephila clavipes]
MATGSYLTPNHSRSQSEIQGDLHRDGPKFFLNQTIIFSYKALKDKIVKTAHGASHRSATRELSATDLIILNHGLVTRTTPELAPPLLTFPPHRREDVRTLDRLNVHRSPARLRTHDMPSVIRYLDHWATAAPF